MKVAAAIMVVGMGAGVVGCAAETDTGERVGQTSQALTGAALGQQDANLVFDAVMAGDLHGLPTISACSPMRQDLQQLEADNTAGYVTITNQGPSTVQGLPAELYNLSDSQLSVSKRSAAAVVSDVASCFSAYNGDTYVAYFVFVGVSGNSLVFDPSAAQLTQNLSSTKGSSAAATDTSSGSATTAWQWPTQYSTGGGFAGGEPCASLAQSAGYTTAGNVQKSGTYSKCVCPSSGGC